MVTHITHITDKGKPRKDTEQRLYKWYEAHGFPENNSGEIRFVQRFSVRQHYPRDPISPSRKQGRHSTRNETPALVPNSETCIYRMTSRSRSLVRIQDKTSG